MNYKVMWGAFIALGLFGGAMMIWSDADPLAILMFCMIGLLGLGNYRLEQRLEEQEAW